MLIRVQGDMQLAEPAASAWLALVDHCRSELGIVPVLSSPGGAWRSDEMVTDMWLHPAKYGASQGTARPKSRGGPGSVHENGLCIDINNWRSFGDLVVYRGFWRSAALDRLCAAHGFHMDARYPNEPWHYQHNGTVPAGGSSDPFETEETIPMPALIRHPNGSIGFVSDAGELDAIGTLNEVESLKATGIVEDYVDTTSLIWDTLTARTARLRAARAGSMDLDEAALAAQIAPLVVAPVVTAVKDAAGVELTVEQVQAASEAAVRSVLGGLG